MEEETKVAVAPSPEDKLRAAVDAVLRTEAGQLLFIYLFHTCGYNVSSLTFDRVSGDVARLATEAKEAQRLVYIKLRRFATRALLAQVEDLAEQADSSKPPVKKQEEGEK